MKTAIVSLFPDALRHALEVGITARALRQGTLNCSLVDLRDHADDARRSTDDRPFGGGPGMVMMATPLRRAVQAARHLAGESAPVILLTPQGERFDQRIARALSRLSSFVLVAGRYEGVDERFVDECVDRELSIGDYILSGGEPAAWVVLDAIARLLPGALGNPESTAAESFEDHLLDCPQYTRPQRCAGVDAPATLLSGDHRAIERWRRRESLARTWRRRPDLLLDRELASADRQLLGEIITAEPPPSAVAQASENIDVAESDVAKRRQEERTTCTATL